VLTQSKPTGASTHYSPAQDGTASPGHVFSEYPRTAFDLDTDAQGVGSNEIANLVQFQNKNVTVSSLPTSHGWPAKSFTHQVDPMAFHYGGVMDLDLSDGGASSNRVEVSGADHSHYVESSRSFSTLTNALGSEQGYGGPAERFAPQGIRNVVPGQPFSELHHSARSRCVAFDLLEH
jgi:hypothetical protein